MLRTTVAMYKSADRVCQTDRVLLTRLGAFTLSEQSPCHTDRTIGGRYTLILLPSFPITLTIPPFFKCAARDGLTSIVRFAGGEDVRGGVGILGGVMRMGGRTRGVSDSLRGKGRRMGQV